MGPGREGTTSPKKRRDGSNGKSDSQGQIWLRLKKDSTGKIGAFLASSSGHRLPAMGWVQRHRAGSSSIGGSPPLWFARHFQGGRSIHRKSPASSRAGASWNTCLVKHVGPVSSRHSTALQHGNLMAPCRADIDPNRHPLPGKL